MQKRRRPAGKARGAQRYPGWLLLLLGLALGVSVMLIAQLVLPRTGAPDGLAGLFKRAPAEKVAEAAKKPEKPAAPAAKPTLDFYTVLPEMEIVLPERARAKPAKAERAEERARYVLQAGSFANFTDADQLKARLALAGLVAQIQKVAIEGKGEFHRVRLGPYEKLDQLDAADQQLRGLGLKPIRLKLKAG